jgi:hypothetical protein
MGFIIGIPFIGIAFIIGIPMLELVIGIAFVMMGASYVASADAQGKRPSRSSTPALSSVCTEECLLRRGMPSVSTDYAL